MGKHLRKYPVCTNCEYPFTQEQPDNFCPRCGQENHDLNLPFQHVALELLEGTIHYDSKFWVTVKYLLFYPGKLTNEFHRGRRVGYVPPIRLYVFISFVFFFLLSLRLGHTKDGEKSIQEDIKVSVLAPDSLTQSTISLRDSLSRAGDREPQILDSLLVASSEEEKEQLSMIDKIPLHATKTQLNSGLTYWGIPYHNWFTRGALQKTANLMRLPKNALMVKAIKYLSVMMFVLMPVFALLLKLVFRRARRYYMEHLIFSIHLHCFFFVLYSIYLLMLFVFTSTDVFGWVNLLGLLYLFLGLRRVFKRSYLRTFMNMVGLLFLYAFASLGTLLLSLIISIAL